MNIFFKLFAKYHARVLKKSGGTKMNKLSGTDILLLNTKGSKSGQERNTALCYIKEGDDYYLVASAGGSDKHPAWYTNMVAHPDAISIDVNGKHLSVEMSHVSEEEKDAWWQRFINMFKQFADYRNKTARNIPIVKLTPKT